MDNYSNLLMDECPPDLRSPEDEGKPTVNKKVPTKGMATSFGFRKRITSAPATNSNADIHNQTTIRRLRNNNMDLQVSIDNNGNSGTDMSNATVPSDRSVPHRLQPPKKEAQATTRVSRFGFRQPNANRFNRITDINACPPTRIEYGNNNVPIFNDLKERQKIESEIKAKVEMVAPDSNKNRPIGKFTLHTNQLPRPQPIKLLETKSAKTLANTNRKQTVPNSGTPGDVSTTFAEDSGVGSSCSENIPQLEISPMSRRLRNNKQIKPRNFEVVLKSSQFDVCDLSDDNSHPSTLPALPTLVTPYASNYQNTNFGLVRDRAKEYQKFLDKKDKRSENLRRNSLASSEAPNHCQDDLPYRRNEKIAKFIKQKSSISPIQTNSDELMWTSYAGEAMADDFFSGCARSDIRNEEEASIESIISAKAQNRLALVDPQFAAIVGSNVSAPLLEEETSSVESIACSISLSEHNESTNLDNDKKMHINSFNSNSKDINEKNTTASSPGSPTNASNSLSLSDDRNEFLIDDEIADQPALLFDDTLTSSNQASERASDVTQATEVTPTLVDFTPKVTRLGGNYNTIEGSPLPLRNRNLLRMRTASLDTLSPCESIASDDCMMDYDFSSGVEDNIDRTEHNTHYDSVLGNVQARSVDVKVNDVLRDWSAALYGCDTKARTTSKRLSLRSSRLLKSRGGTPSSSVPDSPRSDAMKKTSVPQSPLRLSSRSSTGTGTGYESDDSAIVRLDRAQHCAIQQDVMCIKTMALTLKRVLHESETRNSLAENGFVNGFGPDYEKDPEEQETRDEMENLRRQVVFLQGQLEDSERLAQNLRNEMVKLTINYQSSQSAPASVTITTQTCTSNAATQTERIRPISAGPTMLQGATNDLSPGSLVSVNEHNPNQTSPATRTRRSRHSPHRSTPLSNTSLPSSSRLWRMPGEPPSPSAIPRRSCSRSRVAITLITKAPSTSPK